MSCTCRTALSALRQTTRATPRPLVALSPRPFHSSSTTWAAAPAASSSKPAAAKSAPPPPTSSCPAGTVLKGLNYIKDGQDPVALEDSEYPAWLWTLADDGPAPKLSKDASAGEQLKAEKKDLKRQRKVAIKAANALKG
ncbi:hypothetical protein JCM6882_001626 [Rhodosporidiobolus microsporus]